MRRSVWTSVMITAGVGAGLVSSSATWQAAPPSGGTSKTLIVHVVFSPPTMIATNNVRPPHSAVALGDEVLFHDQLFSGGQHVGETVGSCVIVALTPQILNNCSAVFEVPGGIITAQFAT